MTDLPVDIRRIRLAELAACARSFAGTADLPDPAPITRIRAMSQSHNPYARPDDVALLTAVCKGRVIGAHGVMPGLLACDGKLSRVHWSSAVYVAKPFRGRGIGRLLVEAFKSIGGDVVVPAGMTPGAAGAYRSGGFRPTGRLDYCQLRVERIDRSARLFRSLTGLTPLARPPLGPALERLARRAAALQKSIFYRRAAARLATAGEATWGAVQRIESRRRPPSRGRAVFFRGVEAVNWMLAHPWVYSLDRIDPAKLTDEARHYYFTKTRPLFRYLAYEFRAGRGGFVVLSLSRSRKRTTVRILDHETPGADSIRTACALALAAARQILADRIEFPPSLAAPFGSDALMRPLIKKQSLTGVGFPSDPDSPLARSMGRIELSLCDGDSAFT